MYGGWAYDLGPNYANVLYGDDDGAADGDAGCDDDDDVGDGVVAAAMLLSPNPETPKKSPCWHCCSTMAKYWW